MSVEPSELFPETASDSGHDIASGKLLAKNTFYNLLGQILPMIAALLVIPVVVKNLGTERFGVLSLVWMVVGYFTLFDMGIGRATTKSIAESIAKGETEILSKLVWTSMSVLAGFGFVGGILLAACNSLIVNRVLNVPDFLRHETLNSVYMIALTIPLILLTAGARGVLEAQQRFGLINAIKIPASLSSFAAPLIVLPFSNSIYPITAVTLVTRLVVFLIYFYYCMKSIPNMKRVTLPDISYLKTLLSFGSWLTVTNIISPLMTYMDRFIVGAMLTMTAVAYYSTPYDLVTKLYVIPGSLLGVIFPAFSATFVVTPDKFTVLYERALKYVMMALAPMISVLVVFASPLLNFWLGNDFASHGSMVLQLLALGVFVNSFAQVPYTAVQAMGRPDLTAKLHFIELPLYLTMMWVLVSRFGIVGAALAWLFRIIVDASLLYWLSSKMIVRVVRNNNILYVFICIVLELLISIYVSALLPSFTTKILFMALLLASQFAICFRYLSTKDEISIIVTTMKNLAFSRKAIL